MRFIVVGLGSMGKRRVRNLKALGYEEIAGFDTRRERLLESENKYHIKTYNDFLKGLDDFQPDVCIISTPPDLHMEYAYIGYEKRMSCFIEASLTDADKILDLFKMIKNTDILMAPSCTMQYFPGPRKIRELVESGAIGKILSINYQTGQYLSDWHPWEKIEDFYVSKRETGGCREIVPFELTWLNSIFGDPEPLALVKSKLTSLKVDIDDIYHCILSYPAGILANLTVEVISRPKATREMRILGSQGEIVFSSDENCVRYINVEMEDWKRFVLRSGTVESQYINPEEPYINELSDFIEAVVKKDKSIFPNNLLADHNVLQILYRLEELVRV